MTVSTTARGIMVISFWNASTTGTQFSNTRNRKYRFADLLQEPKCVSNTQKHLNTNTPLNHNILSSPVKLLEQIHGYETDECILGCPDAVVLKALGEAVVLRMLWTMLWYHHSSLSTEPLNQRVLSVQTAFRWKGWRRRVPAPPAVCGYQLHTSVSNPVEPLHEDDSKTKWWGPCLHYTQFSPWTHINTHIQLL